MNTPRCEMRKHPPERDKRRRSLAPWLNGVIAPACCCCCCCLHSIGGVGAALAGSAFKSTPNRVNGIYWRCFGVSLLAYIVYQALVDNHELFWKVALLLPGIQLAAGILAAIVVAARANEERSTHLKQVLKLTGLSIGGALLGLFIMWIIWGPL